MKAYLHIGLTKTGTTSIQTWLIENAADLARRGVAYDRTSLLDKPWRRAHTELSLCQFTEVGKLLKDGFVRSKFGIKDFADQQAATDRFAQIFGGVVTARTEPIMVLSNEDISIQTRSEADARALLGWLRRFFDEVHVILYLRRQEDWLLSRYSQVLRHGKTSPLDKFLRNQATQDFHAKAAVWAAAAGADKLHLRLLEPDALVDGDLIADFASVIGVDVAGLTRPARRNEAMSVDTAEFLRLFNSRLKPLKDFDDVRGNPLRDSITAKLSKWSARGEKIRLTSEQVNMIRAANAETNEKLRSEFFPERAELFPARPVPDGPEQQASGEAMALIGIDLYALARMGKLKPVAAKFGLIQQAKDHAKRPARRKTVAGGTSKPIRRRGTQSDETGTG